MVTMTIILKFVKHRIKKIRRDEHDSYSRI